jgi:hypothetical protein
MTRPHSEDEIAPPLWRWQYLWLPAGEPKRRFFTSVAFWSIVFALFYTGVIIYLRQSNSKLVST